MILDCKSLRASLVGSASLLFLFALSAPTSALRAQTSPTLKAGEDEENPIVLSPFEVSVSKDVGYEGGNTLSGSRFDTSLKDTPAAVTVFTKEFLSDFRASNIEDMTAYSPNLMIDIQDRTPAATPNFLGGSNVSESRIRSRGLPVGTALDFFETLIPTDNYRSERFELAVGPNSILFGFANPGGLASTTTKKADYVATRSSVEGEMGSWNRQRVVIDHNQILIPGKLSFRLYGVDESTNGWRSYDMRDFKASTASIRFDPWKNTKITANYEIGQLKAHVDRPWSAQDMVALWLANGSTVKDVNAYSQTADRAIGLNRTTAQGYIYEAGPGGSAPMLFGISNNNNYRILESQYENLNVPTVNQAGFTLLPPSEMPYRYSSLGPGSVKNVRFERLFLRAEQRIGDNGIIELAYNHETSPSTVYSIAGTTSPALYGDPNLTIPNPNGNGTMIANPNAGKLYMASTWGGDHGKFTNDVVRATVGWKLDFGRIFGNHQLAFLAEHGELEQWRYGWSEILVDDNNVPIANASQPENAVNRVTRRQYVLPGIYSTYYAGNGFDPIVQTIKGKTYHNRLVNQDLSGADVVRDINSLMIGTQSRFWKDRIVVTAGLRVDYLKFDLMDGGRVAASDPRVASGQLVANEWAFNPNKVASTYKWQPHTGTLGAVYHVNKYVSLFGNYGSSVSQPTFNAINLVTRALNGPSQGTTHDYGFMLELMEGRIFIRGTAYETQRRNWDSIVLNGDPTNIVGPINRIVNAEYQAGLITQDQLTAYTLPASVRLLHDITSKGYELSANFNLTRSITAILNASKTTSEYSNINAGFEDWFAGESKLLLAPANAANVVTTSGSTVQQELAALPQLMADGRDFYAFRYGERPYKVNGSARYTFLDGWFKGVFVGGGARWQSRPLNGRLIVGRRSNGSAIYGSSVYGPEDFKMDGFIGYRRPMKFGDHRTQLAVQLNVRNLTNEDSSMPLRYNNNFTGLSRTVLLEPRSFRFTTTLEF